MAFRERLKISMRWSPFDTIVNHFIYAASRIFFQRRPGPPRALFIVLLRTRWFVRDSQRDSDEQCGQLRYAAQLVLKSLTSCVHRHIYICIPWSWGLRDLRGISVSWKRRCSSFKDLILSILFFIRAVHWNSMNREEDVYLSNLLDSDQFVQSKKSNTYKRYQQRSLIC